MEKSVFITLILGILALNGCMHQPKKLLVPEPDPTIILVERSAYKIESQLSKLVELESSNRNGGIIMVIPKQGVMARELTISWNGALQPILATIVKAIEYKLEYTGIEPATPLTVIVDTKAAPVYEVLETISWQVSPKVELLVNPIAKTLKVAYTNHSYQRSSL